MLVGFKGILLEGVFPLELILRYKLVQINEWQ